MDLQEQRNPYEPISEAPSKPRYKKRSTGDISDKVSWGAGASLAVAGILAWLEEATGIPVPEGVDLYIVALVYAGVAYIKKERV